MNSQKQHSLETSGDKGNLLYKQTPAEKRRQQKETNVDLIYSREIILDYLRMRLCEEVFHFAIVEEIKNKVKEKISSPQLSNTDETGDRPVDEIFDVEYQIGTSAETKNLVLFRIQIRLIKAPTQFTFVTVNQIIDCIETFLSPCDRDDVWQPTIEDRIVRMKWDEKEKPIPLLVLEQSEEVPFGLE